MLCSSGSYVMESWDSDSERALSSNSYVLPDFQMVIFIPNHVSISLSLFEKNSTILSRNHCTNTGIIAGNKNYSIQATISAIFVVKNKIFRTHFRKTTFCDSTFVLPIKIRRVNDIRQCFLSLIWKSDRVYCVRINLLLRFWVKFYES